MAILILDTSVDPEVTAYEQHVDLEGRTYLLKFDYGQRDDSWYLSLYDQDEDPLVCGKRVAIGIPLLRGEVDSRLPPGILMAVDTTETGQEAGLEDLGARVKLVYLELASLEEVAES
jgi:hypothetical protein